MRFFLGANTTCSDEAAVAISDDRGFLYNAQEMATAMQQKITVRRARKKTQQVVYPVFS